MTLRHLRNVRGFFSDYYLGSVFGGQRGRRARRHADRATDLAFARFRRIRERVEAARKLQLERFGEFPLLFSNARMDSKEIRRFCKLDDQGNELLKMAITKLGLSARAYDRILKVARTIADLAGCESIRAAHVAEAVQYRSLDRAAGP